MQRFTAACAQYAVVPMDVRANIDRAVAWTRRAVAESAAQLVVLPETCTTGFTPDIGPEALWDLVDVLPGRLSEAAQQVAAALGIYLVFPTYEQGTERGVVYNSAALIGPDGSVLGVYRKTHLFPTERKQPHPLTPPLLNRGERSSHVQERGLGGEVTAGWSTAGTEPCVIHTPLAS